MTRTAIVVVTLCLIVAALPACQAQDLSDYTLYIVGQSHIDIAWRWQWDETIGVARDTFGQALRLMGDYPDFCYTQSQAQLYATMEEHYPQLFAEIKQAVAAGRWDIVGGMWVEPDANMPSGESLVRQCLYGQRYFKSRFGVEARTGWLPDTFGMPWTLPQILKKSHMDNLVFVKFKCGPAPLFAWEGPDGSQVALFNAANALGEVEDVDELDLPSVQRALRALARVFPGKIIAVPYGVGDHGGGPTRRDIEMFRALAKLPGMPKLKLSTGDQALDTMKQVSGELPVWRDEVNYHHRGCYSSQAETKRHNRKCETLLPNAERFAVMAGLAAGFAYPREDLDTAWRGVLFNQFHDILPGSSIGPVFDDATALYRSVETTAQRVLDDALAAVAARANTQGAGDSIIVFNPLPWPRTDIVEVTLDYDTVPAHLAVRDAQGATWGAQVVQSKRIYESFERCRLIFAARSVPALGFKTFWIDRIDAPPSTGLSVGDSWLESARFRIEVDQKTGHMVSLHDKQLGRGVLPEGARANVLRLLGDDSGGSTAWEIKYTGQVAELDNPTSVRVAERGPVRATIAVGYFRNGSVYEQRISLYDDLDRVDFPATVDWREHHTALKVCFPVGVQASTFTREIPFGNIAHACNGDEVPALKWIDLSEGAWGVSLLNDSKYGHSVSGSEMTITLLRSPTDPDPVADLGRHVMTYSLYPHAGDWRQALTQRRAEELNAPLLARTTGKHDGLLGSEYSMLSVEPDNVYLAALKLSEDSNDLVVRVWEAHGQPAQARIRLPMPRPAAKEVDLLEVTLGPAPAAANTITADIKPYEIRSFTVPSDIKGETRETSHRGLSAQRAWEMR